MKKITQLKNIIHGGLLMGIMTCISNTSSGQSAHSNPWAPIDPVKLPPIASVTDGVWLKGDLHVHSRHSKESSNNAVAKILSYAKSVGFGFICITDHDNHVDGDVAHNTWVDPEFRSDSLVLLYGAEWTTTRGHGNAFSATPYDHQRLFDVRDQRDVVVGAVKKGLGIHLSANHPSGKDNFGYSYDIVNSIEVWNSSLWSKNANAIMIWDDMLSSGRKLTGRGGSDAHHGTPDSPDKATANTPTRKSNYVGTPTTWVFATTRSAQAVVDALTNGRVSVSANPYSPRVEFYADLDQDGKADMMMGDNAKGTGKPAKFRILLSGKTDADSTYTVRVVKNGSEFGTYKISGKTPTIEFTDTPAATGRTWYRVVVEGRPNAYPQVPESMALTGNMVALSNPIYFNFDPNF
ncbi:histidinol-phosphatase [Niastella caeni]|uniref:Histidinol-phosphatase n=1 Tax=Niastella caeni TaxID=2569763 RepID=A0A4V4H172_9BACT|nr:CehA/McbA family metallohydrolase [Niastella caeni]THU39306.1 histidinol-phosphatase [Niastella caeni]